LCNSLENPTKTFSLLHYAFKGPNIKFPPNMAKKKYQKKERYKRQKKEKKLGDKE
jgi:hypothetical protein